VASHKKLTSPKIKALQILENLNYYSCDNDSFHKNNALHVFLQPAQETKEKTTRMMTIELKAETYFKIVTAKTLKFLGL
jgi:predicted transcriptional regulator YdeE